ETGERLGRAHPGEGQRQLVPLRILLVASLLARGNLWQYAARRNRRTAVAVRCTDGIPVLHREGGVTRGLDIIAHTVQEIEADVDVQEHVRVCAFPIEKAGALGTLVPDAGRQLV